MVLISDSRWLPQNTLILLPAARKCHPGNVAPVKLCSLRSSAFIEIHLKSTYWWEKMVCIVLVVQTMTTAIVITNAVFVISLVKSLFTYRDEKSTVELCTSTNGSIQSSPEATLFSAVPPFSSQSWILNCYPLESWVFRVYLVSLWPNIM